MALLLKINSVDKTDQVNWRTFKKNEVLTNQVDTLDFEIKNSASKTYFPNILDTVEVWNGAVKIFGGIIINIDESIQGRLFKRVVKCKDWTHYLDRKCVKEIYESMTVAQIIADIAADYCTGFTTTNVNCSLTVDYIAFNYEYPSKCIQQLAELFNYDWYVDYDQDVHFFSKEANLAPFDLDDTSGKFIFDSLVLNRKADQMRNVVYVRGGEYQGSAYYEEQKADGEALVYKFGYKYANYAIKVGGVSKTVGIDNLDDPASYDCLYNFNEKAIKFKDLTKPALGAIVRIDGNPYIPVIVKVKENSSIAAYGEYEFKIIDASINSKEGARQRAKAELYAYASQLSDGSFRTIEEGLKVGQKIRLNSTIWGYTENYVINRISSKIKVPDTGIMEHTCSLVTTRNMGIIEFLQKLLTQSDKEIKINEDEVIDLIETIDEGIQIAETITKYTNKQISEGVSISENVRQNPFVIQWVFGPYTPINESDPKRPFALDRDSYFS